MRKKPFSDLFFVNIIFFQIVGGFLEPTVKRSTSAERVCVGVLCSSHLLAFEDRRHWVEDVEPNKAKITHHTNDDAPFGWTKSRGFSCFRLRAGRWLFFFIGVWQQTDMRVLFEIRKFVNTFYSRLIPRTVRILFYIRTTTSVAKAHWLNCLEWCITLQSAATVITFIRRFIGFSPNSTQLISLTSFSSHRPSTFLTRVR